MLSVVVSGPGCRKADCSGSRPGSHRARRLKKAARVEALQGGVGQAVAHILEEDGEVNPAGMDRDTPAASNGGSRVLLVGAGEPGLQPLLRRRGAAARGEGASVRFSCLDPSGRAFGPATSYDYT